MSYGSTRTPTVTVPSEFELVPALSTILHVVDAFGAALVAPPSPPPPVLSAGAVWSWAPTTQPSAVDRRKELTQHLIDWHNQLVTAVRQLDEALAMGQRQTSSLQSAHKTVAQQEAKLERLEAELSTALHTIQELQVELASLQAVAS